MSSCGDRVSWETWREQISANGYYEDGARQEMITPNVKKTWLFIKTVVHCIIIMVLDLGQPRTN